MISAELFGKIIKYHLLDQKREAEDIRKGLEKSLIQWQIENYIASTKRHQPRKKEKSPGRNTWTEREYRKVFDGRDSC